MHALHSEVLTLHILKSSHCVWISPRTFNHTRDLSPLTGGSGPRTTKVLFGPGAQYVGSGSLCFVSSPFPYGKSIMWMLFSLSGKHECINTDGDTVDSIIQTISGQESCSEKTYYLPYSQSESGLPMPENVVPTGTLQFILTVLVRTYFLLFSYMPSQPRTCPSVDWKLLPVYVKGRSRFGKLKDRVREGAMNIYEVLY